MVAELIRPPYNRNGSKYTLLKTLLPLIPPHKIYVEVFAGSAVLFFNKPLAQVNILNDLDKDTIRGLDLLKHSSSDVRQYKQDLDTLLKIKKFFKKKAVSIEDKVLQRRIVSANGFGNKPVENESQIYKHSNPARHILKNLDLYQHYLKNARLYSEDYLAVLKKFDGPSTFFFSTLRMKIQRKDLDTLRLLILILLDLLVLLVKSVESFW